MTKVARGGCLCGWIRFEIAAPLDLVEYCHCSMCRKATGSAFSANAVVRSTALSITSGEEVLSYYESSPNRLKCFCSKCGSQLFIRRTDRPEMTVVVLGAIEGDPHARPERHVFVASKAPWYSIGDTLPQFNIYPAFDDHDDAESK